MNATVNIIIRVLNEARWLPSLLDGIAAQETGGPPPQILLVDSGSTDGTLEIARSRALTVLNIDRADFTFGRSLNVGCAAATGDNLVFISAHCLPEGTGWLRALVAPLANSTAAYTYGRQVGHVTSRFSEGQIFRKYYPPSPQDAQGGFFCNNANAAIRRDVWARFRFDEELTGLEDMELAKRLLASGQPVAYVPEAVVQHIHDESWAQVRRRYEREALALQRIMPEVHIGRRDVLRFLASAILHDCAEALQERRLLALLSEIAMFRAMQYWGSYRGNNDHRQLSRKVKDRYFYPR